MTDSDGLFGETDIGGLLPQPIPIHGVLGDSHGALFGQGCLKRGMMKTTYGTGSSIMMNIGEKPIFAHNGVVTSLAWKMNGTVKYVLEGNINYTGAVISWLKDQVGLVHDVVEPIALAEQANPADHTYLVPAFSGLGAPYWRSDATAAFCGMTRTTGKAELVRAALASIAYQIADIVFLMKDASGIEKTELRVDGGPTENRWLMQFQSDILQSDVHVPQAQELSGIGAAYAAGIGAGVFDAETRFLRHEIRHLHPEDGEGRAGGKIPRMEKRRPHGAAAGRGEPKMRRMTYSSKVSRWGVLEVSFSGPTEGNPFTDDPISGTFTGKNETVHADGFYDGDGIYHVRFMPSFEGKYHFCIEAPFLTKKPEGDFTVLPPEEGTTGRCGWQTPIILPMKTARRIIPLERPAMRGRSSRMSASAKRWKA